MVGGGQRPACNNNYNKKVCMTTPKQPLKVVFAPGVLEQMEKDFTAEELQEALDEIGKLAQNPEQGTPVDMEELMVEDPHLYAQLVEQLQAIDEMNISDKPTLQ